MIKKYQRFLNMTLVLLDAAVLSFAYMFALREGRGTSWSGLSGLTHVHDLLWMIPVLLASFTFSKSIHRCVTRPFPMRRFSLSGHLV